MYPRTDKRDTVDELSFISTHRVPRHHRRRRLVAPKEVISALPARRTSNTHTAYANFRYIISQQRASSARESHHHLLYLPILAHFFVFL